MFSSFRTAALASFLALATASLAGCTAETGSATSEDGEDNEVRSAKANFELFQDVSGQWRFNVLANNYRVMASSEAYTAKASAEKGVAAVIENASQRASYKVLQARDGQYYFNVVAANNEIIATSETYATKSNAERAVERLARIVTNRKISDALPGARIQFFKSVVDSQYYFNLRAANGEIVLQSEGYGRSDGPKKAVESISANGRSRGNFDVRESRDGQWLVVLEAANGEILGTTETYTKKATAEKAVDTLMDLIGKVSTLPTKESAS